MHARGGGHGCGVVIIVAGKRGGVMCVWGGSHTRGEMGVNAHGSSVTRFRRMLTAICT